MKHLIVSDQWHEFGEIASALQSMGISDWALHRSMYMRWLYPEQSRDYPWMNDQEDQIYKMFLLDLPGSNGSTANLEAFGLKMADALSSFAIDPMRTVLVLYPNSRFTSKSAVKGIKSVLDDLRQHFPEAPIFDSLDQAIEWVGAEFSKDLALSNSQ